MSVFDDKNRLSFFVPFLDFIRESDAEYNFNFSPNKRLVLQYVTHVVENRLGSLQQVSLELLRNIKTVSVKDVLQYITKCSFGGLIFNKPFFTEDFFDRYVLEGGEKMIRDSKTHICKNNEKLLRSIRPSLDELFMYPSGVRKVYIRYHIIKNSKCIVINKNISDEFIEQYVRHVVKGQSISTLIDGPITDDELLKIYVDNNIHTFTTTSLMGVGCSLLMRSFDSENSIVYPFMLAKKLGIYKPYPLSNEKKKFVFRGKLRPKQVENSTVAVNHLNTHKTTLLALPTGAGKTVYGAFLATKISKITCIVYPFTVLGDQWKKTFDDMTNCTSVIISPEMSSYDEKDCPDVIICYYERIDKIPKKWIEKVGTLIVDEAHRMCNVTGVNAILTFRPRFIIGETATPKIGSGMHLFLYLLLGIDITIDKKVIECFPLGKHLPGHIIRAPVEKNFDVVLVNTGISPEVKTLSRKTALSKDYINMTCWSDLVNKLVNSEERNNLIVSIVKTYVENGKRVLVLGRSKSHPIILCNLLDKVNIKADYMIGGKGYYDKKSPVLIGTTGKVGTGFDDSSYEVLVMTSSIKDETAMIQAFGRIRLHDVEIVYLVDENKIIQRHWSKAKKWLEDHGAQIVKKNPSDFM